MYTETYPPKIGGFIICLILTLVTHGQGLQFLMEITPDSVYCGHLQCWADKIFTDDNILTVLSLTVYDITQSNSPVTVASLSMFDPDVYVNKTDSNVVNVTGNITNYHAELALSLRNTSYCLNGTFSCELDFVNLNGQTQVLRQTVSPENRGSCLIFSQFAKGVRQIRAHSDQIEKENVKLSQENLALKTEVTRLEKIVNSTLDKLQDACYRRMLHYNSREHILLWDKVAAMCDTETDGGGWIVIQRRTKGDVDFYRGWDDYKNGFGTLDTDFWIGNDNIHNLTSHGWTELRVDIESNGTHYFAHYSHFYVANESSNYRLSVSGYNGTAGDSLTYHDGCDFSTFDRDNDKHSSNYAFIYYGAWWYNNYLESNLNGQWRSPIYFLWDTIPNNEQISYFYTEMKVRNL